VKLSLTVKTASSRQNAVHVLAVGLVAPRTSAARFILPVSLERKAPAWSVVVRGRARSDLEPSVPSCLGYVFLAAWCSIDVQSLDRCLVVRRVSLEDSSCEPRASQVNAARNGQSLERQVDPAATADGPQSPRRSCRPELHVLRRPSRKTVVALTPVFPGEHTILRKKDMQSTCHASGKRVCSSTSPKNRRS